MLGVLSVAPTALAVSSPGVGRGLGLEAVADSPYDSEVLLPPESIISFSTSVTAGAVTASPKLGGREVGGPSDADIAVPSDSTKLLLL